MTAYTLIDAARLMDSLYDNPKRADIQHQIDINGVQALLLKQGVLVIPGTNEAFDWVRFNFEVKNLLHFASENVQEIPGDSGMKYHAGFLQYARIVYAFAKSLRPKFIIGHSLGAAAAQIVGSSLRLPTIAFASPRVTRAHSRLPGEVHVLNVCRTDDFVTQVPPIPGYRCLGNVLRITPKGVHIGEDHRMNHYISQMKKPKIAAQLPPHWPFDLTKLSAKEYA